MEKQNDKTSAKHWYNHIGKILIALIILSIPIVSAVSIYKTDKVVMEKQSSTIDSLKINLSQITFLYSMMSNTKDSLSKENKLLSRYRSLTDAMVYRDSIRKPLMFTLGDIAHMKRDSSRVLIKDILVGGGKFNHYIEYKVEFRDKTIETVSPEFIY